MTFKVGDKVYVADVQQSTERYQCPDCGGLGEWTMKTAIDELQVPCGYCSGPYEEKRGYLVRNVYALVARLDFVGKVTVEKTANGKCVEYMVEGTGVGSGRIWREDQVYATEKLALEAANDLLKKRIEGDQELAERERRNRFRRRPHYPYSNQEKRLRRHVRRAMKLLAPTETERSRAAYNLLADALRHVEDPGT